MPGPRRNIELPTVPPSFGAAVELAPHIHWARLPIPMRLNHVNVYLFEDEDGWTIFDTGIANAVSRHAWENILGEVVSGKPVLRIIVSHFHLDHVALAGWLTHRFGAAFYMSQGEYLLARVFQQQGDLGSIKREIQFFQRCGLPAAMAEEVVSRRTGILTYQTPLPASFERLTAGDIIRLGMRDWHVLAGGGHAVEQLMLYCREDELFLAADQVLPEITPNISVGSIQPGADPLGDFLNSLDDIRRVVSDDACVLPGHRMPFYGLHNRIAEIERHHADRCALVLGAAAGESLSPLDLVSVIFNRNFDNEVIGSAVGEALAHANYLMRQGQLSALRRSDGVLAFSGKGV